MRIGSLCSGYGGLDLGVIAALGGSVAWHVEYDAAPSKILAHHWPDVPNHGDVKTTDWSAVEPVGILTAGYPCQPFSVAGKRKGVKDDRHLWPAVCLAIGNLRPGLVVLENVRGMFPSASMPSLVTFPASGMTRGGELFELPMLVPATIEPDYSSLLPTPVVNDRGAGKTIEAWDEWTATMQAKHGGNGHGPSLEIETLRLLSECTRQQSTVGLP